MKVDLSNKITRNPSLAFTQIDDDLIVMRPEDSVFYGINAVGAEIWSWLDFQPLSLSEICEKVTVKYDVEPDLCADDVITFTESMLEHNIFMVVD